MRIAKIKLNKDKASKIDVNGKANDVVIRMIEDACSVEFEHELPVRSFHRMVMEHEADDDSELVARKLCHDEIELLSRMLEMLPLVDEGRFAAFQTSSSIYHLFLSRDDIDWMVAYVEKSMKEKQEADFVN